MKKNTQIFFCIMDIGDNRLLALLKENVNFEIWKSSNSHSELHTITIRLPRTLMQKRTNRLFFDLFWSNALAFTNMCNVFKPWNAVLPEEIQNFSTAILRLTCNWSNFPPKMPSGTILVAIELSPMSIDKLKLYP